MRTRDAFPRFREARGPGHYGFDRENLRPAMNSPGNWVVPAIAYDQTNPTYFLSADETLLEGTEGHGSYDAAVPVPPGPAGTVQSSSTPDWPTPPSPKSRSNSRLRSSRNHCTRARSRSCLESCLSSILHGKMRL